MGKMNYYSSGELELIKRLRAQGFGWRDVADRTGRSYRSLKMTGQRAKKPFDHRRAENEQLVAEFEAGKTATEIARARGWTLCRVLMRLNRMGLDSEMRAVTRPLPIAGQASHARP